MGRCETCAAFTYDAHELSEEDLRRLVLETEGRVLTSLVRRTDGRVMSIDCGHGTVRTRRPLSRSTKVALVVIAVLVALLGVRAVFQSAPPPDFIEDHEDDAEPPVAVPLVQPVAAPAVPETVTPEPPAPPAVVEQPAAQALRVDVHLSEVSHTWDRLVVQPSHVVDSLEGQLEPVRSCYRTTLESAQGYRGVLSTRLFVERDGHVSRVSTPLANAKLLNPELERCVTESLKNLEFPGWGAGQVAFKLVFAGVF